MKEPVISAVYMKARKHRFTQRTLARMGYTFLSLRDGKRGFWKVRKGGEVLPLEFRTMSEAWTYAESLTGSSGDAKHD